MRRGGGANRSQRGILLWALMTAPACNLIVGFEPRDLCEDCSPSAGTTHATGGSNSTEPSDTSGIGGADSDTSAESATVTGGSVSDAGGADDAGTSSGGGSEGTDSAGSGSDVTNSGSGGTDTSSGGTSGGTATDSGGTAGSETVSSTGAGGTGGTGTGGTGSGGTGGATNSTTTSSVGGSATVGGSGGTGGTGGTTGTPSPCELEGTYEASNGVGVYPAALRLGRSTSPRPWDFTWLEGGDIYVSALSPTGEDVMGPTLLDSSGTHTAPSIATQSLEAFVVYGELAAGNPRVVMQALTPGTGVIRQAVYTGTLEGDAAPRVVGVALKGTTTDALVAAINADGSGLLALFDDNGYVSSYPVEGPLEDMVPVDLGTSFAIAFVRGDALQVSVVPYEVDALGPAWPVDTDPEVPSLGSLGAAPTDSGAALVWLGSNGVRLATVDDEGETDGFVEVSSGNDVLPRVDVVGQQIFVSWVDTSSDTLYLQRVQSGGTGTAEEPFAVAEDVADVSYGFAADPFSTTPTLGFVYSTDRLYLTIITCTE